VEAFAPEAAFGGSRVDFHRGANVSSRTSSGLNPAIRLPIAPSPSDTRSQTMTRPQTFGRIVRSALFGAFAFTSLAVLGGGCLDRPVAPATPTVSARVVTNAKQNKVSKIDLLFMIDNSSSMADKQVILANAVPDLVTRLVDPVCINPLTGQQVGNRNVNGGCAQGEPDFDPIKDIHVGIISSSLGGHGSTGVCDDPDIRKMVIETLKSEGYQTVEADSAGRALELARSRPIDGFLIDIDLPGKSGVEVSRELRSSESHRTTPIVLYTQSGRHDSTVAAYDSRCNDVIVGDPLNADVLRNRLKEHIQRTEHFEQLERTRLTMISYLSRRTLEVVSETSQTGIIPPPEERDLAILFTDLRGFTAMSEEIEPVRLFELVSA